MGRPRVGEKPLTSAEKSRRSRQNETEEEAALRREKDRLRAKQRRDAKRAEREANPPASDDEDDIARKAYQAEKRREQRAAKAAREQAEREALLSARRAEVPEPEPAVDLTRRSPRSKCVIGYKYAERQFSKGVRIGKRVTVRTAEVDVAPPSPAAGFAEPSEDPAEHLQKINAAGPSSPAPPPFATPPAPSPRPTATRSTFERQSTPRLPPTLATVRKRLDVDATVVKPATASSVSEPPISPRRTRGRKTSPKKANVSRLLRSAAPGTSVVDADVAGYISPGIKVNVAAAEEISEPKLRGYTPRKRDPVKEAKRNEQRKCRNQLKKQELIHKAVIAKERLKNRSCRTAERVLQAMANKVSGIKSSHKRRDLMDKVVDSAEVRKNRIIAATARVFGLNEKTVARTKVGRREQKARIAKKTFLVLQFFQDPQWSITYPGKKDLVCCRYTSWDDDGKGTKLRRYLPKVVLTENLKELHKVYNRNHPNHQVNLKFFQGVRRRSQFIKPLSYAKADVCLCQRHQNYCLKMRAVRKYTGLPIVPDTLVRNYTEEQFKAKLQEALPKMPNEIHYDEWKLAPVKITVQKDKKTIQKIIKKLRPVPHKMRKDKFVKLLEAAFPGIKVHVELAAHQHKTVRNQRENLKEDEESTIQLDFAQNWLVGFGEEVQSAFYAKDPVTVHPAVLHVRIGGKVYAISLCLVSDDRRHDAGAVFAILTAICKWIKANYPKIKMIHFWSDSPSSQYRNVKIFSLICRHVELFGFECTWSYFEAGHGKGPCDGVGAAAKKKADRCIKAGGNITCAEEFVRNNSKDGSVHYILVPIEESFRARELLEWLITPRKVPGTMKVHNVMIGEAGRSIFIRAVSCYSECCWTKDTLRPRLPQIACKEHRGGDWAEVTIFTPEILAKLDAKRREAEKKQAAEDRKQRAKAKKEAAALRVERYEEGEWVAAIYGEVWWVGKVESVMEDMLYAVNFMHPVDGTPHHEYKIDWPELVDMTDIEHEDILCVISEPVNDMAGSRFCKTLPAKEIKSVNDIFESKF